MLLTEKECKSFCEKILRMTSAEDATVSVGSEDYSHLRFAANAFTTNGRRESVSAGVTVWINRKAGSSSASGVNNSIFRGSTFPRGGGSSVSIPIVPVVNCEGSVMRSSPERFVPRGQIHRRRA